MFSGCFPQKGALGKVAAAVGGGGAPPGGRDEAFGHRIPAASCHRDWADGAVVVEHCGLCGGCHGLPRGPPRGAMGRLPSIMTNMVTDYRLLTAD